MKRLNNQKITKIISCYTKFRSLRKVRDLCDVSLGTAHNYVSGSGIIDRKQIVTSILSKDERLIGAYVGLWMGDGTQYYNSGYDIKICSNKKDEELNKFIQRIILDLFNKKTCLVNEIKTNQAYIKFESKFIFDFIYDYIDKDEGMKTHSVRLKQKVTDYSRDFLEGCFLGLMLSDGYLKKRLGFNVTSKFLAINMVELLKVFGFNPKISVHDRRKYGWHDLYMVRLNRAESKSAESLLDEILIKLGQQNTFVELKYGEPGRI